MHRKEDGAKALFTDPSDGKPIRNQRICQAPPTNASIENRAVSFTTILDCSKQVLFIHQEELGLWIDERLD
jgi:hypothetical protein